METKSGTSKAGKKDTAAVQANPPLEQTTDAAASPSAAESATKHGGNRGGRKRDDGLVPGSPEAVQKDLDKDRIRKAKEREANRRAISDPLPSKGAALGDQLSPSPAGETDLPPVGDAGFVPWTPDMVRPATDKAIGLSEKAYLANLTIKSKRANLPDETIAELKKDGAWDSDAKDGVSEGGADCIAAALNALKVPTKYRRIINLIPSVGTIGAGIVATNSRLDKLIALQEEALKSGKK